MTDLQAKVTSEMTKFITDFEVEVLSKLAGKSAEQIQAILEEYNKNARIFLSHIKPDLEEIRQKQHHVPQHLVDLQKLIIEGYRNQLQFAHSERLKFEMSHPHRSHLTYKP